MNFKYLLIILVSLFLIGCKGEPGKQGVQGIQGETGEKGDIGRTPKIYEPLDIDLSGKHNIMLDVEQMASKEKNFSSYMYAAINFVVPDLMAEDPACMTAVNVDSGFVESIINDSGRCLKKVRKVDVSGDTRGFAIWEEEDATGDTVQVCGIIKPDGTVNELAMDNCPKQNAGFKNNPELHYVSPTQLRGLSNGGNWVEYDTLNDTTTVIVSDSSGDINMMLEVDRVNVKAYHFRVGNIAKKSVNGVVSNVPELDGKYPHKVGTDLQFKDGNAFKRAYFDASGDAITYQDSNILYQASAVPIAFADWLITGIGVDPQGPVINDSLNNCDSNKIGDTTILLCPNGVYKYGDSESDLSRLDICALGNCGRSTSVSCVTSNHYYIFTPFTNGSGDYTSLRLTKININNESTENIFDINDYVNGVIQSQVDYFKINSMKCTDNTVTATTNTKTIIINNADSTPDISYLDIVADGVI